LQPIISTIFTRLYIKIDSEIILSSKMCKAKIHLPLYFVWRHDCYFYTRPGPLKRISYDQNSYI